MGTLDQARGKARRPPGRALAPPPGGSGAGPAPKRSQSVRQPGALRCRWRRRWRSCSGGSPSSNIYCAPPRRSARLFVCLLRTTVAWPRCIDRAVFCIAPLTACGRTGSRRSRPNRRRCGGNRRRRCWKRVRPCAVSYTQHATRDLNICAMHHATCGTGRGARRATAQGRAVAIECRRAVHEDLP